MAQGHYSNSMALEERLLSLKGASKDDMRTFPAQSFARGGVGTYAVSMARSGINRLPQFMELRRMTIEAEKEIAAQQLSPQAAGVVVRPWERNYVHPSDFVPSGRVSRNDDLPLKSGSRWATLSLYENDPRIIRGQLRKLEEHKSSTAAARGQDETLASLRRAVMGAEQRAMFGRQRMEQSLRYVKSGLSTRPSYEMAGASLGATDSLASTTGNLTARMGLLSTTAARRMLSSAPPGQRPDLSELAVQLPASSYVQVRSRLEAEHKAAITQSGQRAVATARKAADARERQTISRQLHELDQFEYQLRAGSKKKNGSSSQQRESGDNY